MAESIWSYEGDVAPQKNSYFPDAAPSRAGSRFTYSTPDAQRFAAGVLAPAQAAIRQAEEEDLKRRDSELAYQHNKAIHEASKEKARQEAEVIAMDKQLAEKLGQIQNMISVDPVKAQTDLSGVIVQNPEALKSDYFKGAYTLMSNEIRNAAQQAAQQASEKDTSIYNQIQMYAGVDNAKAVALMPQIKDANLQTQAAALIASNESKAKYVADVNKEKEDKASREKAAENQESDRKYVQRLLLGVSPVDVAGDGMTLRKEFSGEAQSVIRVSGLKLGLSPEEIESEMKKDPIGFHQKLLESTVNPVAGVGAKRNVGTTIQRMTPSAVK